MKIVVLKASDYNYKEVKTIKTLNDLKAIDTNVIVNFNVDTELYGNDIQAEVTIYDYYVE